jgi:uncharacterized membrane protein YgcG
MTLIEWWAERTPHFRCPQCGRISFNHNDIAQRYCGRCHLFADDPPQSPAVQKAMRRFNDALAKRRHEEAQRRPQRDSVRMVPPQYRKGGSHYTEPLSTVASRSETKRDDDYPTIPAPESWGPPSSDSISNAFDPTPSSIDPGGGSSGGGGASGDW